MKNLATINSAQANLKSLRNSLIACACFLFISTQITAQEQIGLEVSSQHTVLFGDSLQGKGEKMIWLPAQGAIRAGGVGPNFGAWEPDSIGAYSAAFGFNNKVKGQVGMSWGHNNTVSHPGGTTWGVDNNISNTFPAAYSTVWGSNNTLKSHLSTVWGQNNKIDSIGAAFATGWGSDNIINGPLATVWGVGNTVVGELATVWGEDNQAKSDRTTVWGKSNIVNAIGGTSWGNNNRIEDEGAIDATVWGLENIVEGNRATAWGSYNSVSGSRATAWGLSNIATGISSTAFGGNNIANGGSSMAVGQGNTSNGYATSTLGVYAMSIGNEEVMTGIPTPITADYPLFVVGNGSLNIFDFNNPFRSNALTVTHKGYVGINFDGMPNADLVIKQSDGGHGPSTGGIALLDDDSINEYWQIQTINNALTFKRNGSRISRLTEAGVWEAADFYEGNLGFLRPETQKSTKRDITNLRIGYTQTGKRAWDAESLVGVDKNLVSYDEDNQPFGVNYKLLYMMTIEKLQDQQKVIEKQGQINLELSQQLQYLVERFVHLEKIIKEK